MIKNKIFLLILLLVSPSFCEPNNAINASRKLYNAIHFTANGNDVLVELDQVKQLLDNEANPNWINTEHQQPESVLSRYVDLTSYSKDPNTIKKGTNAIKLLFDKGAKLQYCDGSILFSPIARGKYEITKLLLENGVNATSWPREIGTNMTPVEKATAEGYDNIIELLIVHGASRINKTDAAQLRFVEAATFEPTSLLKKLVKEGAKVNKENPDHQTALINALAGSYDDNTFSDVLYLLELGANVNQKAEGFPFFPGRRTPLSQAILHTTRAFEKEKSQHVIPTLILQVLIEKGAYVSSRNDNDKTPLHLAAEFNNIEGARILLEAGCKVMDKDQEGKTPLDYAKSAEMIKLLKSHGAKEQ